ncbi:MAG: diguanylate cyclase [Campylobacterales bacterium]|nr:diguanylate cyclase [Campylobacterales bacterium]
MERSILDQLEVGVIITDANLVIYEWNRFLQMHTQLPREAVIGKRLDALFEQVESAVLKRKIRTTLRLRESTFYRPIAAPYCVPVPIKRFIQHDLNYMVQRVSISPYDEEKGLVLLSIYDETDSRIAQIELEKEMQKTQQLNARLTQDQEIIDTNLMMLKTDLQGRIVEASSALCSFYGYDRDTLLGRNPSIFGHKSMPSMVFHDLWEKLAKGETWRGEVQNLLSNGKDHWADVLILPFYDEQGVMTHYVGIYHDISDRKRLESLYVTDPLTKLFNRYFFDQQMKGIFMGKRRAKSLSMMLIDIDHFKQVNDIYGHRSGDLVLQEFAQTMRATLRNSDVCIRMGGEEFAVLLPGCDLIEACSAAEHLRQEIEKYVFTNVGRLTCSIGVAQRLEDDDADSFYERTDMLLYAAKTQGRNRIAHDAMALTLA